MEEVKVTIGMDAGPAERELAGLQGNVHRTEQVVKGLTGTVQVSGEDIVKVIAAIASGTKSGSDQVTKKLEEVVRELGRVREASNQTRDANKEHTVSINDMTGAVSALPGPVGQAASAFSHLTSIVKKFIGSPLLWFLAAVAAAYQYLTWSLNRTVEGQEKLDLATAKYQQRLENVKDAASSFGRAIYSALDSAANVSDKLLGKLGGIGRILGSLGGSALGPLGSVAGGMVGDWTWNRNVGEAVALQQRENELWQKRKAFKTEEAQLEQRIAEARARAYDDTLSAAEQEAAVKAAVAATNELYDKRKQIAEETRDIAVGRLGLSDSDREAEMAAEQAKADVVNLETQRQNALRFLNRMSTRLNNQDASDAKAAAKAAMDALEQRDALFRQQMTQEEAHTKQHRAALNAQAEARIAAIEDASERERAEAKHQHELRLQQIQAQAETYRKANYEAAKKAYEAVHGSNTYSQTEEGGRGWAGVSLTKDQSAEIEAEVRIENAIYARGVAERYQNEIQAMHDYLKEYGTIEEKRYAITREYDEKIAKEGDLWRKKSLEAEKNSRLAQINARSLATDIDWGKTFSGLGTVLQGIAKETIDKIEQYMKSAEFGALSAADKKAYTDLLNEIRSEVGFGTSNPFASSTWDNIDKLTKEYQQSVRDLITAQGLHRTAVDNLIAAEEELKNATEPAAKALAEAKVQIAQGVVQQTAKGVEQAKTNKDKSGNDLNNAANAAAEGLDSFSTAISGLLGGSLKGFADGLIRVIGVISGNDGLAKGLEGLGTKVGGIISLILQLMDTLGEKPVEFIDELFEHLEKVVEAVIANLPEIITHAMEGVFNIFGGVFNGILSWFGVDLPEHIDEIEETKKSIDSLISSNDNLASSVDMLTEAIDEGSIMKAVELAEIQIATIQKEEEQNRQALAKAAAAYEKGDYGNFQNSGVWKAESVLYGHVSEVVDAILGSGSTTLNLAPGWYDDMYYENPIKTNPSFSWMVQNFTSKDWYTIATELPELWNELIRALEQGDVDASEYLKNSVTYWKEIEGAENRIREKLTSVSFDTIASDFNNVLLDMDSSAEDFSENFGKYMQQAVINSMIMDKYKPELQKWYESFAEAMKGGMTSDNVEYAVLMQWWDEITEGALEARDSLKEVWGWTTDAEKDISSLSDTVKSALLDLTGDVATFSQSIRRMMYEELAQQMVFETPEYKNWLAEWQEAYQEALETGDAQSLDELRRDLEKQYGIWSETLHGCAEAVGYSAEAVTTSVEDMVSSVVSSLTNTDQNVEEWAKDFRRSILQNLIKEMIFSEDDMSAIREAMAHIMDGIRAGLGPEDLQQEFDLIEGYVSKGKSAYEALAESWGVNDENLATPFSNLKDDILDSLTDLENGAEDFKRKMQELMIKDVIEKMVLGNEVETENADGSWSVFDTFNDWLEDWQKRYSDILNDATLSDEERETKLQALIDEAVAVRESEADSAERFAERLKAATHDTTFKDMAGNFRSALLDMDADAESFAESIRKTMAEKVMQSMTEAAGLQSYLDSYQDYINAIMEGEGSWEEKMEALQPFIDDIVAQYEELAPLAEKIRDAFGITQKKEEAENPFSNLKDSFVDALTDVNTTAKDFGRQIGATLAKEMINRVVEEEYGDRIKTLSEALQDAIATGDADVIAQARFALESLFSEIQDGTQSIRDTQKVIEELSDTTFTDMGENWTSVLTDMDATAGDLGREIGQTLVRKLVQQLVVSKHLQPILDNIQDVFDKASAAEGATVESVIAAVTPYINEATEATEQWKPYIDAINEAWQQVGDTMEDSPFSDLRSTILSQLMEIEGDVDDLVDSINTKLVEHLLDKYVLSDLDDKIKDWTAQMKAIEGRSDYSPEDIARETQRIKDSIAAYGEGKKAEAEYWQQLMGITGYSDQGATMNMSDKATYEQMDQYLGTQLGIYMATEEEVTLQRQILATLQSMGGITKPDSGDVAEIRGLVSVGNDYLRAIRDELQAHLGQIKNNTANLNKL